MEDSRVSKEEKKKIRSEPSNSSQDRDPRARPDDMNSAKPAVLKLRNEENESCNKPSSLSYTKKNDLESAKAEMGQVLEENKRLKSDLDRIMKDYQSLQMRFHEIAGKPEPKTPLQSTKNPPTDVVAQQPEEDEAHHELSLSLGRNSSLDSKNKSNSCTELLAPQETIKESGGLSLALDYKNEGGATPMMQNSSVENSLDETKDEARETWPPIKVLKTEKSGGRDEEVVQQPPVKKARVSVRARCDTPTMNDGCQWRKYGQKIAKGNPCPRAYYRCTVAPSCPVRKQVQRCADDMSILITTYEGTHNHPLPISATAMASTTSAAAYMLISGSSTSNCGIGSSGNSNATTSNMTSNPNPNFPGLNFNMSDASRPRALFFPNSSYSPSPSQPTITLDLTSSSTSSSSASQFSKLTSASFAPRASYPSTTNLTFNSLDLSNPNLPMSSWPPSGPFSYTAATNPTTYKQSQVGPTLLSSLGPMPSSRDQDSFYQTLFQKINPNPNSNNEQPPHPSVDTVAAAAKAITSDPSFQSVLTAALSSLIGASNNANGSGIVNAGVMSRGNSNVEEDCHTSDFTHNAKWGNQSSSTPSLLPQATNDGRTKSNSGCASSFLSIAPNNNTTNAQAMVLSSPLPFSTSSKSTSTSPGGSRDQH